MRLYINLKKMTFEEDNLEHKIIFSMSDKEFYAYDVMIELSINDKFIKDTLKVIYKKDKNGNNTDKIEYKIFKVREDKVWYSFPKYEIVDEKIVSFDYTKYQYFRNTDRRNALGAKINRMYGESSEMKIQRKTLKYIMDTLQISYPDFFEKYNNKIEELISKNPKGEDK